MQEGCEQFFLNYLRLIWQLDASWLFHFNMYEGGPKITRKLFIKILCIYSYMLNHQSPSKCSPFDIIHLLRCFSTAQNSFELVDFDAVSWFYHLFFFLFYIRKMFPFEDIFHLGKQKKVIWGEIGWIGRVLPRGHAIFYQKLLNIQHSVGRCARKSPIMKCERVERVLKREPHWRQMQLLTTMPAGTLTQMSS